MRQTPGGRGKRRNETYFWASGQRLQTYPWGHPRPSAHSVKLYSPSFPSSLPGLPSSPPPTTPRAWTAWSLPRGEGPAKSPLLPSQFSSGFLLLTSSSILGPSPPVSGLWGSKSETANAAWLCPPLGAGSSCPGQLPQLQCDHGNPAGLPSQSLPAPAEREGAVWPGRKGGEAEDWETEPKGDCRQRAPEQRQIKKGS